MIARAAEFLSTNDLTALDSIIREANLFFCGVDCRSGHFNQILSWKGFAHQSRYRHSSNSVDLNEAIYAFNLILASEKSGTLRDATKLWLAQCKLELFKFTYQASLLEEAIGFLRELALQSNQIPMRAEAYQYLALGLWDKFRHVKDLIALEEAIEAAESGWRLGKSPELGDPAARIDLLGMLLYQQYQRTEDLDYVNRAIQCHEEAVGLASRIPRHPYMHIFIRNLGLALKDRWKVSGNNYDDLVNALKCLEESLLLCPKSSSWEAGALHNLALALDANFDVTKDLKLLHRAAQLQKRALSLPGAVTTDTLEQLLRVATLNSKCFSLGQGAHYRDDAILVLEQALAVVQTMLYKSSLPYKLHRQSTASRIYEQLISLYLSKVSPGRKCDEQFLVRAFEVAEMAKSAVLSQLLNSAMHLKLSSVPKWLIEKELSLSEKLLELELQDLKGMGQASSEEERLEHSRRRDAVFAERELVLSQIISIGVDSNSYVEMRKGSRIVWSKLCETISSLGSRTALLSLFHCGKNLIVFVVRAGVDKPEIHIVQGEQWEELSELLSNFNDEVLEFEPDFERMHQWRKAGKIILAPIMRYLEGIDHLVISPHREFHGLPFHALYVDDTRALMDICATSYVSGVGSFMVENVRKHVDSGDVLVMGVPPFEGEAQMVAELYSISAIIGGEASSNKLREQSGKTFDLIHLSCHAILKQDPLDSALQLGDGMFTVRDWLELQLPVNLVVLSACQSAVSGSLGADEQAGFAQAITLSGARSAILSQWSVNAYTTELMLKYFHQLYKRRANDSIAELLRQSAIALRDGKLSDSYRDKIDYSDPAYWAAFCLYGKWL
ncbi:MAG: CHAT domain-containing protein [Candidatus Obscuribacterales bacterium]|nr:CHAT domain-containing protein [Candidatus Obscuribacterales bacterium]